MFRPLNFLLFSPICLLSGDWAEVLTLTQFHICQMFDHNSLARICSTWVSSLLSKPNTCQAQDCLASKIR